VGKCPNQSQCGNTAGKTANLKTQAAAAGVAEEPEEVKFAKQMAAYLAERKRGKGKKKSSGAE